MLLLVFTREEILTVAPASCDTMCLKIIKMNYMCVIQQNKIII